MEPIENPSMNTPPASRAERILVWDAPVRVMHWLLAASFAGAWLTAEAERWQLVHVTLGYTVAALVLLRIVWGLAGTRYARFTQFVRGPGAVLRYLRSLVTRRPEHHVGHNPAGALAIVGLLGLALATAAAGVALDAGWGGHALEEVHEALASTALGLVALHVAAVVASSLLHGENLVAAMFSGRKRGDASQGIRSAWRSVAVVVLCAVLGFWWLQWREGGALTASVSRGGSAAHAHHDDDD
jgi:cytochrome b